MIKLWNILLDNYFYILLIHIVLIFFLPWSMEYGAPLELSPLAWRPVYPYLEYQIIFFLLPLPILLVLLFQFKRVSRKFYFSIFVSLVMCVYSFYAALIVFVPLQDFQPHFGLFLQFLLAPNFIFYSIMLLTKKIWLQKMANNTSDID